MRFEFAGCSDQTSTDTAGDEFRRHSRASVNSFAHAAIGHAGIKKVGLALTDPHERIDQRPEMGDGKSKQSL